jgi:hypothetical protein
VRRRWVTVGCGLPVATCERRHAYALSGTSYELSERGGVLIALCDFSGGVISPWLCLALALAQ